MDTEYSQAGLQMDFSRMHIIIFNTIRRKYLFFLTVEILNNHLYDPKFLVIAQHHAFP